MESIPNSTNAKGILMEALDTNIILLDANNIYAFAGPILLAATVIDELDSKKSDLTEIGFQAREFGRIITKSQLISTTSNDVYAESVFKSNNVEIHIVELKEYSDFKDSHPNIVNDRKIIEVTKHFNAKFISNDVMARIRASAEGIESTEFRSIEVTDSVFTKFITLPTEKFELLEDPSTDILVLDPDHEPENYNYVFRCASTDQTKLTTVINNVLSVLGKTEEADLRKQDIPPINAQQLFMCKYLQDPLLDMLIVESPAGTGKSAVAISNGIRLVRQHKYEGILYVRSSVNDVDPIEEVGFLPGLAEKFAVYLHPLEDTLDFIIRNKHKASKLKGQALELKVAEGIEALREKANIKAITTLGMRGRTFSNYFIIIDEFQNLSPKQAQKILTRIGQGCKVVLLGSNNQIDNKYITKHTNGMAVLLNACKTNNEYITMAAVDLTRIVRSPMAEFTERLFSK
jgi:PhoH-like ATPase